MIENAFLLFLVQSAILIAATHVALLFLKRSPALRQAIIRASLVGCVALAAFSVWSFNQPPASLPRPSARVTLPSLAAPAQASTLPSVMTRPTVESAPPATKFLPELPIALTVWLVGVLVGSLYLGAGLVKLRRLKQQSRSWTSAAFDNLAAQLGHRKVAVRTGGHIRTPFVTGALRPTIFLPESLTVNPDPTLELVLRHELAHVTNRDLGFLLLHRVLTIVLWPQVLLWTLRKPMLEASEEVCDRVALSTSTGSPTLGTDYAKALVALHERFQPERTPSLAVGMVRKSSGLRRRITAILDPTQQPESKRVKFLLVALATLTCGSLAVLVSASSDQSQSKRGRRQGGQVDPVKWLMVQGKWPTNQETPILISPPSPWNHNNRVDLGDGPVDPTFRGPITVTDANGKALSSGDVWLIAEAPHRKYAQLLPVRKGQVVVPKHPERPRSGRLVVNSTEGIDWMQLWPSTKTVTNMKLSRPETLRGRLLLPNGNAARKMQIYVRMIRKPGGSQSELGRDLLLEPTSNFLQIETQTDEEGMYTFNRLPAGCLIRLDVSDLSIAPPSSDDEIQLGQSGQTNARDLRLRAAGSISGRVSGRGRGVAGTLVGAQSANDSQVSEGWGAVFTNYKGEYRIHRLPPGTYNLIADFGYTVHAPYTAVAKERITVTANKNVSDQNFEITSGVVVSGTVRNGDGSPVWQSQVLCYSKSHPKTTSWVQSVHVRDGMYKIRVPAGEISISLADGTSDPIVAQVKDGKTNIVNIVRTKKPNR